MQDGFTAGMCRFCSMRVTRKCKKVTRARTRRCLCMWIPVHRCRAWAAVCSREPGKTCMRTILLREHVWNVVVNLYEAAGADVNIDVPRQSRNTPSMSSMPIVCITHLRAHT
jgi:hypothetical protein